MRKIIMIFGGQNGFRNTNYEHELFDSKAVELSDTEYPSVLLLAYHALYEDSYMDVITRNYGGRLNCNIRRITRYMLENNVNLSNYFNEADIIYLGGGNTMRFMKMTRKYKVDKYIVDFYNRGGVVIGDCCGAIAIAQYGNSIGKYIEESELSKGIEKYGDKIYSQFFKIRGLGLAELFVCPHYDVEPVRKESLKRMLLRTKKKVAIAGEAGTAAVIEGKRICFIRNYEDKKVYKAYWDKNVYYEEELMFGKYIDIEEINRI